MTPARCDVEDGYIHPFYEDSPPDDTLMASGSPSDPYALEEDATDDSCVAAEAT